MSRKNHSFIWKIIHWPVCSHCGLIWLKNVASNRAAKGPCRNAEDD